MPRAAVAQVEVGPLTPDEVAELVAELLGGPVDAAVTDRVVALAGGSPQVAHELVVGAREAGWLEERDTGWTATADLARSPRVRELVSDRVGRLDEVARRALDRVALARADADRLGARRRAGRAGRAGAPDLVAVVDAPAGGLVRVAHPLHGEVLRAEAGPLRRRLLLGELVGTWLDRDVADPDHLRLVLWAVELDLPVAARALRSAARLAFATHRFELAGRLLDAVPTADRDADHRHDLMCARFYADDVAAGAALLTEMVADPADDADLARALEHEIVHAQVGGDIEAAERWAAQGRELLVDPSARQRVEVAALSTAVLQLPAAEAAEALGAVAGDLDDAGQVAVVPGLVGALATVGRTEEAAEVAERAHRLHRRLWVVHTGELVPSHPSTSLLFEVLARTSAGRIGDAADRLAVAPHVDGSGGRLALANVALAEALVAHRAGRMGDAADGAAAAREHYGATLHHHGPRWVLAVGFGAVAAAHLGRADEAVALADLLATGRGGPLLAGFVACCRAQVAIASDGPARATGALAEAAALAAERGDLLWAA